MKLELLDGVEPLKIDVGLVEDLLTAVARCEGNVPRRLVFGVRNLHGQIYRRILTESLAEVMAIAGLFERLGFVDEISFGTALTDDYDGIFSAP
jgi:hypothetical protein